LDQSFHPVLYRETDVALSTPGGIGASFSRFFNCSISVWPVLQLAADIVVQRQVHAVSVRPAAVAGALQELHQRGVAFGDEPEARFESSRVEARISLRIRRCSF